MPHDRLGHIGAEPVGQVVAADDFVEAVLAAMPRHAVVRIDQVADVVQQGGHHDPVHAELDLLGEVPLFLHLDRLRRRQEAHLDDDPGELGGLQRREAWVLRGALRALHDRLQKREERLRIPNASPELLVGILDAVLAQGDEGPRLLLEEFRDHEGTHGSTLNERLQGLAGDLHREGSLLVRVAHLLGNVSCVP